MAEMEKQPQHPYNPKDLQIPGFVANHLSFSTILSTYLLLSFLAIYSVWILSGRLSKLAKTDRLLMCWFIFTSLNHIILEFYIIITPEFYKEKSAFYVAEVWKEYCKADSRYITRDSAVLSVETIFIFFLGPSSLLAAYAIAAGNSYSYILQFAISIGHLFGDGVYFISPYLDGKDYAASPFYFYLYYVAINSPWVVLPILICLRSWRKICAVFEVEDQNKIKDH